jgi:hypothetical protein
MNYKKIIPNQNIRFFILKTLSFLPAKLMLKLQYFIKFNRNLDLKNPKRFTEKVQHYKLFYRNLEMCNCVDKYLVRDFVVSRGSEQYLNELYGVFNKADDIDFSILPNKFVVKTTDGGGGENVFLCKDKSSLNISSVVRTVNNWRNKDVNSMAYEWAYEGAKKSRIVIEKYLEDKSNTDGSIDDYKFFCFEGKLKYTVVDVDRYVEHKRNFYDANWNLLDVSSDCPRADRELIRPLGFDKMVELAEKLSKGFPFVRIDLYNIQGEIIFGEMTFYPWSGYVKFIPDSFDFEMGKFFNVNY